jgi:hypothetical protein
LSVSRHIYHVLLFTKYLNDLDSKHHSDWIVPIEVFRKIGWSSIPSKSVKVFDAGLSRNESERFGALKSYSTHHFFRNACTKSGSLQFSGC